MLDDAKCHSPTVWRLAATFLRDKAEEPAEARKIIRDEVSWVNIDQKLINAWSFIHVRENNFVCLFFIVLMGLYYYMYG